MHNQYLFNITHVFASSIYILIVKGTPFLGLRQKQFKPLFWIYLQPDLSSPNGVVKRYNMDNMGFFMLMPSFRKNIIWYFWVQNINRKQWQSKKFQCIFIGRNKIIWKFSKKNLSFCFPSLRLFLIGEW